MSMTAWRDAAYDESYDKTYKSLVRRRAEDPLFKISDLAGILLHLYVQDGNDQGGRGGLQDALLQSMIDAHEHFLADWKAESLNVKHQLGGQS